MPAKRLENLKYVTRDNAGIVSCYSLNRAEILKPFGTRLVSATKVVGSKYKKGDLTQVVVTGHKRFVKRRSGVFSKLDYNGVIPLKKDGSPLGTRVYGAVYFESRLSGYTRLAILSKALL